MARNPIEQVEEFPIEYKKTLSTEGVFYALLVGGASNVPIDLQEKTMPVILRGLVLFVIPVK